MFIKKLSLLVLPLVATFSLQANDPFSDPFFQDPFGDEIFKEMMQVQQNMDKMFQRMHERMQQRSSGLLSPLGTYHITTPNQFTATKDGYELRTNIPQSKENHIDIHTQNGVMSITAKIIEKQESKTANSVSQSSSVRMYQQTAPLPKDADENSVEILYKEGRVVVHLKKLEDNKNSIQTSNPSSNRV